MSLRYLAFSLSLLIFPTITASAARDYKSELIKQHQQEDEAVKLELNQVVTREINGDEIHSYQLNLHPDDYVDIVVEQQGIDVTIQLLTPEGKKLLTMNSPNGSNGREAVGLIAPKQGNWIVQVVPNRVGSQSGKYQIRIAAYRKATTEDRDLIVAQNLFLEAQQLYRERTETSVLAAIEKYTEAATIFDSLNANYRAAVTLNSLGIIYRHRGEFQTALEYYQQALALYQKLEDRHQLARMYNTLGAIYWSTGSRAEALAAYQESLGLSQDLQDRLQEVRVTINIGLVYWSQDEYQQALEYYNQALPLAEKLGDWGLQAYALNNIGLVYWSLGERQLALEYYAQALPLVKRVGHPGSIIQTLNQIGVAYFSIEEYQLALKHYTEALTIAKETSNKAEIALLLSNIGNSYAALGEYEQALTHYQQSLELRQVTQEIAGAAITLSYMGQLYLATGEYDKAEEKYNQALTLTRKVGNRSRESFCLYGMAIVELKRGNLDLALTNIEAAITIIEDLRNNVANQELRASFFASKQDYYKFYIDLLMQLHAENPKQGYDAKALNISERSRARSLLELLAEANADVRQGIAPELLQREREIQQQLHSLEKRYLKLKREEHTAQQITAIEREMEQVMQQYRNLQTQIRTTSPSYAALQYPQPFTLEEIQHQVLDEETLLLQYSLGKERSYLWAVSKNGISSYELPPQQEIETAVKEFRRQITNRLASPKDILEASTPLSNAILAPIASQLDNKRLLVVADGTLQYIPFAALTVPGNREYTPLIAHHEIVNSPSASTVAINRHTNTNRTSAPHTVAIFADPVFNSSDERIHNKKEDNQNTSSPITRGTSINWNRLPGTRQEATAISQLVPDSIEVANFFDFQASKTTATSPQLGEYHIIHFATHGFVDTRNPQFSGVVMSLVNEQGDPENGFLRLNDIFNLNLPVELVVLSACNTGGGELVRGEGLIGLTRGFMYAGAPRVVASLWQVSDEGTAALMSEFYRQMLQEGKKPAQAMRQAQLQLWQGKKYYSPYYWSAFTMQGEWK